MITARRMIEKWQIKAIHACGNELGIVDKSARTEGYMDQLHMLIHSLTGKESTKDLTFLEANTVINRLKEMMKGGNHKIQPQKDASSRPGMASDAQIRKIWRLMYVLESYDQQGVDHGSLEKRLNGVVKKHAHVSAVRFLTKVRAKIVIEALKEIIKSEENRNSKKD